MSAFRPSASRFDISKSLRFAALLSIMTFLFYKLTQIGWLDIFQSLPSSPIFYLLSLVILLAPILAEVKAFKMVTLKPKMLPFKLFVRKHILNKAVLSYSGEAYLIQKLSQTAGLDLRSAATIIKDLALVRTFVANLWVIILVLLTVLLGNFAILQKVATTSSTLVIFVSIICLGVCFGTAIFFRNLTKLSWGTGLKVVFVFVLRSCVVACVMVAQWSLAIPGTSVSVWLTFLVVFSLARKSPVGGEMVFITIALALPGLSDSSANIAAMLISLMALNQINYFIAFLLTSEFSVFKLDAGSANGTNQTLCTE